MGKVLSTKKLSETLIISECTDGFWLWDKTRQMNLAMKETSETNALVCAMKYYQRMLSKVETDYETLTKKVDSFLSQFVDDENLN